MVQSQTLTFLFLVTLPLWAGVAADGPQPIQGGLYKVGDAFQIAFQDLKRSEITHRKTKVPPSKALPQTSFRVLEAAEGHPTKIGLRLGATGPDGMSLSDAAFAKIQKTAFSGNPEHLAQYTALFKGPEHILENQNGVWKRLEGPDVDPKRLEYIEGITSDLLAGMPSHRHSDSPSQNLLADIEILAVEADRPTQVAVSLQGAQVTIAAGVSRVVVPGQRLVLSKKAAGWVVQDPAQATVFPNALIADQLAQFFEDESFVLGLLPKTQVTTPWSLSDQAGAVLARVLGEKPTALELDHLTAEWVTSDVGQGLLIQGRYQYFGGKLEGMPFTVDEQLSWTYEFQAAPFRLVRQRMIRKQQFSSTPGMCDCVDPEIAAVFQDGVYHWVVGDGFHAVHAGMVGFGQAAQPAFGVKEAMAQAFSNRSQMEVAGVMPELWNAIEKAGEISVNPELKRQLALAANHQKVMEQVWKRLLVTKCVPDVQAWLAQEAIQAFNAKLIAGMNDEEVVNADLTALGEAMLSDPSLEQRIVQWTESLTDQAWYQDLMIDGVVNLMETYLKMANAGGKPVEASFREEAMNAVTTPLYESLAALTMAATRNKSTAEWDHLTRELARPEAMVWYQLQKFVGQLAAMDIATSVPATAKPTP